MLYIDDLDRCPPRRVVQVLEAVHLILALELFVVVLAVDPRWLLQSLELHYSELLAGRDERPPAAGPAPAGPDDAAPEAGDENEDREAWLSTPLNYLEKIIQIPFALRPMGQTGGAALVRSLLPVALSDDGAAEHGAAAAVAGTRPASQITPGAPRPHDSRRVHTPAPPARRAAPSLSPRALALTPGERDFAASIASILRTPRAVKKFTNLYRLLRAGLDETGGELDRFLHDDGENVPECEAVLILLAVLIAFPEQAGFLLEIGDLAPDAPTDRRSWEEYAGDGDHPEALREFVIAATDLAANGATSTREPFRRWALEISRYSFATGQEVFASYLARAPL